MEIFIIMSRAVLKVRNVSDKSCRENQNTYFIFKNPAVCEVMWKNMAEPDKPQVTIRRMRVSGWIPKATHTHSEYVIIFAFPL
jgi:hypothetical protein